MKAKQEGQTRPPVLVVDDKPSQLKTIADILETEELQPICCKTGKEACKHHQVNVAIIDLRLPDMEGLEVLRQLKQLNPEIKVIVNTGYASLESAMTAVNREAFAYVEKTGNVDELLAHVHRAFHAHLIQHSEKLEREVRRRTAELSQTNEKLNKQIIERKKTNEILAKERDYLEKLHNSISEAIFTVTIPKRKIVYVNSAVETVFGYKPEECIGRITEILYPNRQGYLEFGDKLKSTLKEGNEILRTEHLLKRKSGDLFPAEITTSFFRENGEVVQVINIVRDITDRKSAEAVLRASEGRYRTLVESAQICIHELDLSGNFVSINPGGLEMMRACDENKVIGSPYIDLVAPEDRERIGLALTQALGGYLEEFEFTGFVEGDPHVFSSCFIPLKDENGRVIRLLGYTDDVTEVRLRDEQIVKSEEKYRDLFESASDVILFMDGQGSIVDINWRGEAMSGYSRLELVGMNVVKNLVVLDDRHIMKRVLKNLLTRDHEQFEVRWHARARKIVHLEGTATSLIASDRALVSVRCILRDITERKIAEHKLSESRQQLELALKASNIGLFIWDWGTNETYLSPLWKAQLGYEDHEVHNRFEEWEKRLHPDDRERVLGMIRSCKESQWPDYEVEFRLRHKDGSYRWILTRADVYAKGKSYKMMGCHIDITERKRTEAALKESEENFRNMFQFVPDPLVVISNKMEVLNSNKAFDRLVREYARKLNMGTDELRDKLVSTLRQRMKKEKYGTIEIEA